MKLVCFLFMNLILFLTAFNFHFGSPNSSNATSKIVSEFNYVKPGQAFWIAVKFKMQNEWHIYWRNSGDSGLPTAVEWTVPDGFLISETNYPYPNILVENSSATFIYENEVLLLARVTPPSEIKMDEIEISANADWLECKQACLPGNSETAISLKVDHSNNETADINLEIMNWLNKLPIQNSEWNFDVHLVEEEVYVKGISPAWVKDDNYKVIFFPYADDLFNHSKVQEFKINENGFSLKLELNKFRSEDPKKLNGILVISDSWLENENKPSLEISKSIIINKEK